jgi:hypothetical protein
MHKFICVVLAASIVILSCKNKQGSKPDATNTAKDSSARFPIIEMFKEDVDDVQKTPYFIYKITASSMPPKRLDSVAFNLADFLKTIAPLMQIDVSSKTEKRKYNEVAFHDLSTNSYSVITTAIENNTDLKSMTALLNDETNKLKSVYFVTEKQNADTTSRISYFWKVNKSLRIVRSVKVKEKLNETTEFINWNDNVN